MREGVHPQPESLDLADKKPKTAPARGGRRRVSSRQISPVELPTSLLNRPADVRRRRAPREKQMVPTKIDLSDLDDLPTEEVDTSEFDEMPTVEVDLSDETPTMVTDVSKEIALKKEAQAIAEDLRQKELKRRAEAAKKRSAEKAASLLQEIKDQNIIVSNADTGGVFVDGGISKPREDRGLSDREKKRKERLQALPNRDLPQAKELWELQYKEDVAAGIRPSREALSDKLNAGLERNKSRSTTRTISPRIKEEGEALQAAAKERLDEARQNNIKEEEKKEDSWFKRIIKRLAA